MASPNPKPSILPGLFAMVGGAVWVLGLLAIAMENASVLVEPADIKRHTAIWVVVGAAGVAAAMRWMRAKPTSTGVSARVVAWGIAGALTGVGMMCLVSGVLILGLMWLLSGMH